VDCEVSLISTGYGREHVVMQGDFLDVFTLTPCQELLEYTLHILLMSL
jgi:hypothetical protein